MVTSSSPSRWTSATLLSPASSISRRHPLPRTAAVQAMEALPHYEACALATAGSKATKDAAAEDAGTEDSFFTEESISCESLGMSDRLCTALREAFPFPTHVIVYKCIPSQGYSKDHTCIPKFTSVFPLPLEKKSDLSKQALSGGGNKEGIAF